MRRLIIALVALAALAAGAGKASAYIYWTNPNYGHSVISRANNDGTGMIENFIPNAGAPFGIGLDAGHIYWGDPFDTSIGRANLDSSNPQNPFILLPDGDSGPTASGIATDGTYLYWTNFFSNNIERANLDGSDVRQAFITGGHNPYGITIAGGHLYWSNSNGETIGTANLDGTGVQQDFISGSGIGDPEGMATDGTYLYWANNTTTIARAKLDGTDVEPAWLPLTRGVDSVAVDEGHLYWSSVSLWSIGTANLDGTGVNETLITGVQAPEAIAVNDGATETLSVVKAGPGSGTVSSVPAGIDCGSTCTATYERHTVVTLTATPASGSAFAGFTGGGCSGTATTCKVTMNDAESVTARFRQATKLTAGGLTIRVGLTQPTGSASAILTAGGQPLAGKTVSFSAAGHALCSATTNAAGQASCSVGLVPALLGVVLNGGSYQAAFAGDADYGSSTATGGIIKVSH